MQNIITLGQINDALKFTTVTAAQLAEMGFAALANKPICEALPQEEARRLRTAKLYPAESIGQIRVALAKRLAAPASCLHQIQEPAPVHSLTQDADGIYYMQDARWSAMVGNCPSFWRLGGGYTTNLDEAERFTFEAALKQHKCRDTDLPWLCSEVEKLRRPTVDFQYMPRSWDDQRATIAAQAAVQRGEHV